MDEQNRADPATPASGREARRRFLKNSSGAAVALPAAILLLSASRANADTAPPYSDAASPLR
ncbi:MAG TPA: twin-arginine translocation signal domain-containing protein [Casimicrobiaceae bacterium]